MGHAKVLMSLLFFYLLLSPSKNAAQVFLNVKDFGAKGNGIALDSKAINKAIETAAKEGGGTIYLPAGSYLAGSVRLKNNISLFIDQGAIIIAAPVSAKNDYDEEEPGANNKFQDGGHSHWHNSLIWGEDLHDVSIIGKGIIWGKGLYSDWVYSNESANKSIALVRCHNVTIRDISIRHGGWFAILVTGVNNFTLDNAKIDTNRDGVDIDCCKNVRVTNCNVNSPYDDGICLKSSFALGYTSSTENTIITNCQVSGYDEGSLLNSTYNHTENPTCKLPRTGGIKLGTESNGGFKNIIISNCAFNYCRGIALETVDGALLEDVTISNIIMDNIVTDPIFLRLGARMRGPKEIPVGSLKRVIISNVVIYNANAWNACTISGIPGHDIEDITLDNIHVYYAGGGTKEEGVRKIPEDENKYPEPGMFGANPAYGLFVRHARNIKIMDVKFYFTKAEYRSAIVFDDAKTVYIDRFTPQRMKGVDAISLKNVTDFKIYQSNGFAEREIKNAQAMLLP